MNRISDWRRVYRAMRHLDQTAFNIANKTANYAQAQAYQCIADAAADWLTATRPKLAQWKRVSANRARR